MLKVENARVYGIENACRVARYPMASKIGEWIAEDGELLGRLARCKIGAGHDNALNGVIVQFDLTASNKFWTEVERYHFIDYISSQSTMHCIAKMELREQCNEYVTEEVIGLIEGYKKDYLENPTEENYMVLLYNIPSGFELTAGMTTNYRQLKTMYEQRKNHRLPDWKNFCEWIRTLPNSEWITGDRD